MLAKGDENMPTKNPRVTFMVSEDMLQKIEDYKYDHRMKNQTQAILSLINRGIEVLTGDELAKPRIELSEDDKRLIALYHTADPIYKSIVIELLENHPAAKKANRA